MPTANPVSITTSKNTPVVIDLLASATGDGLSVVGLTTPGHGVVVLNPNMTVTYTPAQGYVGPDSFDYTVRDVHGTFASSFVEVTVASANQPPVANDITVETEAGVVVRIAVLDAASDPDGDPLSLSSLGMPEHGNVAVTGGQEVDYLPKQGFVGEDGFSYGVTDGRGGFASGNVTVQVLAPNSPPIAVDDHATTARDTPVTIDVLANDSDPDGDPLSLTQLSMPSFGQVTINADQTIRYTPQAGFVGTDSFSYAIDDSRGGTATASVTITVGDLNTPPIANDVEVSVEAGSPVTIDVLANDSDPDGDPLSIVGLGAPAHGTVTVNADNTITYTPDIDFVGTDSFGYTIGDGRGGTASATVAVNVVGYNAPPIAMPDRGIAIMNTPLVIAVLANDVDPEGGALQVVSVGLPDNGSAAVNPDNTVTYTPDQDFVGIDGFAYTVADPLGKTAIGEVTVYVVDGEGEPFTDASLFDDQYGWANPA